MSATGKRKRRQAKMRIRSRGKFKVGHKLKSGRTGQVHEKNMRCPSKKPSGYKSCIFKIKITFKNGTLFMESVA